MSHSAGKLADGRRLLYRSVEIEGEVITTLLIEPPSRETRNYLNDSVPVGTILGLAAGARELAGRNKDGEMFPVELGQSTITSGDEVLSAAFVRDVSERKKAQHHLAAHYAATCILAETTTIAEALPRILRAVCTSLEWEAGTVWKIDPALQAIRCVMSYEDAVVRLRREAGCCQGPSGGDIRIRFPCFPGRIGRGSNLN